jgi:hypothetical protein
MRVARPRVGLSRRSWGVIAPLGLYLAVAFLFFGLRLLTNHGSSYVGPGHDPQVFVWAFAWFPHAILHGENPFVTHAVWAPSGVNLTWATMVPGLALLFSPLTLAAGAVTSYNVAAVLMPALAAWTAFLLCRYLTRQLWPSLVGGYLFGFSSYMLGQELGHLHVSSVFLLPLVALVVLRYLRGELDDRGLIVRLGPLLALQLLFTTEIAFTLTLALACSIALGLIVAPGLRRRLVKLLVPLAASYLLAAILTAPFLYYLLAGFQKNGVHPQQLYVTDLANFVVPTRLSLAGLGWAHSIAHHFPGNDSERGAYLGVPTLLIIGLFAWQRRRTAGGRFLVAALLVAALATLGAELTVDGKTSLPLPWGRGALPLPWEHLGYLPLFNNVLVERLSLYVALAAALMVSLWTAARRRGVLRVLLPVLAILAIVPDPGAGVWATTYTVPPLFTSSALRSCLAPDENILPLPVNYNGYSDLWQVADDFRFTMAGGYVLEHPPASFLTSHAIALIALGFPVPARQVRFLRSYIREKHVTTVIVDKSQARYWSAALNRIATPHTVGGVLLYRVDNSRTVKRSPCRRG